MFVSFLKSAHNLTMKSDTLASRVTVAFFGLLLLEASPSWAISDIDQVLASVSPTDEPPQAPKDFWLQATEKISGELQKKFSQDIQLQFSVARSPIPAETPFTVSSVYFDPRTKRFSSLLTLTNGGRTIPVEGNVRFLKRVPVLKQSLNAGETLLPHHLDWVVLEDDYRVNDVILDPQELTGAILKRSLHVGDMPQSRYLKTATRIDRGDPVEVTYQIKNLSIRNTGARALASGKKGDLIPVTNPTRSKDRLPPLWGVVEARGHVSIQAS
jgi:flagella basal body P-ring formation protein FlgA